MTLSCFNVIILLYTYLTSVYIIDVITNVIDVIETCSEK